MLGQRVASAVIGVPIIIALVVAGGLPYAAVAALVLAIAGAEFAHLQYPWTHLRTLQLTLSVAAVAVAANWGWTALLVALGATLGAVVATSFGDRRATGWTSGGILYAGGLGSAIVLLRDADNGRDWVLLAVLGTFAVDTAAYFAGRTFGKHKMSPRISPKKTWEGFAGGYAGGFAAVLLLNYLLGIRIAPDDVILLALLFAPAATVGDLVESALKRRTDVKDASDLIPGHGGLLDRLDSLLFTFALVYAFALLAG